MSPIRHDETLMRLIRDVNEIKSALRRTVANLPLYDIANENTPTTLSANQNDYVPGNYDILRLSSTANVSITGIANGKKGRRLQLFNVGSFSITLSHSSSSSIAANRFDFVNDSDFIIPPSGNVMLYYDSTLAKWVGGDMASIYDVVNEVTPSQITADQNNYDIGLAEVLRLSTDANRTITGFSGGVKGRFLEILNVGSFRIALPNESTSSSAANRIVTPYEQSVVLLPDARANLYYDSTQQRWTVADLPNIQGQFGKYAIISHSTQIVLDNVAAFSVTDVTPDTVTSDEWGYWDTTNKLFRIPTGESGLYSLVINYKWNNADTNDYTSNTLIYKNTSDLVGQAYSKMFGADNNNWPVLCMANFFAESGDEIDIRVQQSNGASATRDLLLIATGAPLICFSKIG